MKRAIGLAVVAALAAATVGVSAESALAAKANNAYAMKKAECKREVKAKHFGIHFIQRDRWIKNCIAGQRT